MMILKTAYWTTAAFSSLVRENKYANSNIIAEFNRPARAIIKLIDPDGSMVQKYDSDADGNHIYVGSGRVNLVDSDDNIIFDGRIMTATRGAGILTLTCDDWLSQLNDAREHYDMREDLDGSGLRESVTKSDPDGAFVGPVQDDSGTYYMFDNDMAWSVDQWDGYYLLFTSAMAGSIKEIMGPYDYTLTDEGAGSANDDTDREETWFRDEAYHTTDQDADFYWNLDYEFRANSVFGSLYDSLKAARVHIDYRLKNSGAGLWGNIGASVWMFAPVAIHIGQLTEAEDGSVTMQMPEGYMSLLRGKIVVSDGYATVRIRVYGTSVDAGTVFDLDKIWLEFDVDRTGYSSTISITGNTATRLTVGTNLDTGNISIFEGCPYSICKPINLHINTIVTGSDPLVTLTTDVESTSGITSRHFSDRTRWEMLNALAPIDNAVFWIPIGTNEMKWKITTDASAKILRDRDVITWSETRLDIDTMKNQVITYGERIGDNQLTATINDATSQADYDFVRTNVVKASGVLSDYDAAQLGTSLVNRDKDVKLGIQAVLKGLSDIRLGDWITVESLLLGIDGDDYIVTKWTHDDKGFKTTIILQPKSTVGYQEYRTFADSFRKTREQIDQQSLDTQIPHLYSQEW